MKTNNNSIPERFELKYIISAGMMEDIVSFIRPYCQMDTYSSKSPDTFYSINSLYFDSPNFYLLRLKLEGASERFNIRIRSYGENYNPPFFFEIKKKKNLAIKKFRASSYFESIPVLEDNFQCSDFAIKEKENFLFFHKLVLIYQLEPKVLLQYRRCAFFSEFDDYARITFDRDLKAVSCNSPDYRDSLGQLVNYIPYTFTSSAENIIMELKCHFSMIPAWMMELIKIFGLRRNSFSKYMTAIRESQAKKFHTSQNFSSVY